jgi:hypothetical protein
VDKGVNETDLFDKEAVPADPAEAGAQARAAIASGADPIAWVRRALTCRDGNKMPHAKAMLTAVIDEKPYVEAAFYELAFIHRLESAPRDAVRVLDRFVASNPVTTRVLMLRGHMLHALGAHAEGDAALNEVVPMARNEREWLALLFELGAYLKEFPLGRALLFLDRLKARSGWLETAALAARIGAALQAGAAFAMVRLGDGEGSVLKISEADEAEFPVLYDHNRAELIHMWFGPGFEWRAGSFLLQAQSLPAALAKCDVIGIPYESWLKHEYGMCSQRGVPSLVNVYRKLLQESRLAAKPLCSQVAHIDLFQGGHLAELLRAARRVTVISCLPEIAGLIKERFSLDEAILLLIPAEEGSRHLLGEQAGKGVHYPAAFERILAELSKPHHGRLFLVAGGLLGKFYCAAIRANGGIALDIGSLVDAWTGHQTRPGYDEKMKL